MGKFSKIKKVQQEKSAQEKMEWEAAGAKDSSDDLSDESDPMDKRSRMLKSKPSSEPTNNNFVDSYYPNRPSAFESFSLYNIAINFRIRGQNSKSFLNDDPSDNTDIVLPLHESQQDILSPLFRHQVKSFKVDRFNAAVDVDTMQNAINEMNEQQQTFFNLVVRAVADRESGRSATHYYCSGTASTGKTYAIDCLADFIEHTYGDLNNQMSLPSVLLAAPTGLAAISIKGQTIHSLFGIKVQTSSYSPYEPLSDEQRDCRRTLFQHVKLIIIDEISMVGSIMLQKINLRLKEILGSSEEFGGVCVATFGDLLQLPPVKSPAVFAGLTRPAARKIFNGCGMGANLWHSFRFYELTINMRQNNDPAYAEILEHTILNVRASSSTPPTAIELPNIAGGLTSNLVLTENARVMLKRNIDQTKGLVNGLTGVLEDVVVEAGSVTSLSVRFDRIPTEVISITRVPVVYSGRRGSRHCRLQFPIELAYAVSIHKSQGLTLDSVILSTEWVSIRLMLNYFYFSRSIFAPSQLYVASSRVKRLSGLHLIDLNPARAYSDISAVDEYERLRTKPACLFEMLDFM
ncbi:hypothetical protein CRE_24521 [Caenorhabditis remanei]|uniref:ATP-dependent DNA helicase n=1 Tax=Caenorhabditis remanei TaxID=31234 RepID=E3MG29_CAERE|nr:hypothetical protein CRE_24521 [Caenorhabditis remanei]